MAGAVYLALAMLAGDQISQVIFPKKRRRWVTMLWARLAGSFGVGILAVTWAVYFAAWGFYALGGAEKPLLWANLLVLGLVGLWLLIRLALCIRKKTPFFDPIQTQKPSKGEVIWFLLVLAGLLVIFFHVFQVKDGRLLSGFTVFSDYAPHTAMIRSFSRENNYPTQYPHFGGTDVRYHFMFQFLAGNLEFLGMRMDIAYNLISVLSLTGFFMMLLVLCQTLGWGLCAGVFGALFFVFRSGTAFFRYVGEHALAGDLGQTLKTNTGFIGYTANESWGLWNFNVYLNQRHLAFGLLIASLVIWMFLEWLREGTAMEDRGGVWLCRLFFSREAWAPADPIAALLAGSLLGLATFWNGAAVIGALLILAGMALFSKAKLDYLFAACAAVFFSLLQSKIFIWGEAVSPSVYLGFLADEKTISGVMVYLIQISGFFFLGMAVVMILGGRRLRTLIFSFLLPLVFAFTMSLTPDVTVNEKYIMISYAFLSIIWGGVMEQLLRGKTAKKLAVLILTLCLTLTGLYDFIIIVRNNGPSHSIGVDLNSPVTDWLNENLNHEDLLLTPQYSINEVTMAGEMLYCGWPYYAWSAGYDTWYRGEQQKVLYTTKSVDVLRQLAQIEGITYVLYEEGSSIDGEECRETTFRKAFPLVFEHDRFRIYKVE